MTVDPAEAAKKAAIAAAMARAKAQREAAQPKNTEALTPEQARDMAEIEARRVQAGIAEAPAAPTATKTEE